MNATGNMYWYAYVISGEFDNLHQVLRVLYDEMMPLCGDMTGVAKGLAGLGALFYVPIQGVAVARTSRSHRRVPAAPSLRAGSVHPVLPHLRVGHNEHGAVPVVQGYNQLLEAQTFDMNEYRAQKDRLEYEALMRNPETAYLASDEEFDRQLDELGWSPSEIS